MAELRSTRWRTAGGWFLVAAGAAAVALPAATASAQVSTAPVNGTPVNGTPVNGPQRPAANGAGQADLGSLVGRDREATVKAFNAGDAEGLSRLFLENGELVDENGNIFSGRAEIAGLFKSFFERFPKSTLEMEVSGARAIGDSLVVEEGVRRITAAEGAAAAQLRYVAVREKVGDGWPIASYREFADDPLPTPQEMLQHLSFLVGDWVDESPEGRTSIGYRWSEDGNFLIGDYVHAEAGVPDAKSTQRIGWDPVEGTIRSWTFDSDGGFSQGEWTPLDDGWITKSEATMPDGTTASATVIVTVKDKDHFVVRSTDRIVAGAEEPDFELAIARRPPQPSAK
ncbi:MAG: nuclear transport factor 2 family protein [Planctomycetia bacterium]|nr:nuclear transport factor 2 family protein [Planctomycetia bacterium]